ncbi:Serine/threonine protein kinase [Phytophthora megakarya]|uniref:Serine/threonine protein kinase n=1 Tax=Phytophthora megakarya TaxID=4795 RepID=A0A225VP53_9STRA|nr:Serine/threonine protein kinase [Phytophthora megakarya]
MCIVEALRIIEITTTKNKDCVSLPWGDFGNNVVKYHVTREKLPTRPKLCTDDEWGLVKLMCAYNPKDRIKVSTVVDKLAALAGVNKAEYHEIAETESVKLSQEEVEKMKRCCDLKTSELREQSSMNQVVLHSVYGLLWDRFHDLCVMNNAEFGCLQRHFDRARLITRQLSQCPNTLPDFTEMVMNGYALHRELDKAIDANFWFVDHTSGGLHDWKSKCTSACGANVNSVEDTKWTALFYAVENDRLNVARFLLEKARKDNNLDVIRLLAECGADIIATTSWGETPLICAVENGRMDVVQFLAEFRADVNASNLLGHTPLMHEGTSGNLDIAKYLVKSVPMSIWLEIGSGRYCFMRFMVIT